MLKHMEKIAGLLLLEDPCSIILKENYIFEAELQIKKKKSTYTVIGRTAEVSFDIRAAPTTLFRLYILH